jgi:hypothetical protein
MKCKNPRCSNQIKPPKRKFCSNRCKDRYHNIMNPRGIYAHLNPLRSTNPKFANHPDVMADDLDDYYYRTTHPFDPEALGQE